jgi:hypothetical protein
MASSWSARPIPSASGPVRRLRWHGCARGQPCGINANRAGIKEVGDWPSGTKHLLRQLQNHQRNFLGLCEVAAGPVEPVEPDTTHRRQFVTWATIAMILGRKIKWDPEKEEIVGDARAARMAARPAARTVAVRRCRFGRETAPA